MKRVALICDYSLEYLGGAQSAFLDQASILRERGHDVTIVAPTVGSKSGSDSNTDVRIKTSWVMPGVDLPIVRNSAALRQRLRAVFEERSIDVVHVHSEFGLSAAAISVAADLGLPIVHTVHTFFWQGPALGYLDGIAASAIRIFSSWLRGEPTSKKTLAPAKLDSALRGITLTAALHAGTVISPSAHQATLLRDGGLQNVAVVPNAMLAAGPPALPLTGIDGPLRIVWVGRLVPEKRILPFVDAVVTATNALGAGEIEVTIVGEGPLFAAAKKAIAAAPIATQSSVTFLGRVGREEVREAMAHAHLVALTSLGFDNQPVIVVEAFNEARSVLYVDSALQEGLADAGILCGSEPADMAAALVELAKNPDQIVASSHRASQAAAQFSPARHVRTLEQIYGDDASDIPSAEAAE